MHSPLYTMKIAKVYRISKLSDIYNRNQHIVHSHRTSHFANNVSAGTQEDLAHATRYIVLYHSSLRNRPVNGLLR